MTGSLSIFLDSVMKKFDNVTIEFSCNSLVLVTKKLVSCQDTKFVEPISLYTSASGNCRDRNFLCRDKHFSLRFVYSITTKFSMSRQDFFGYSIVSIATEFSFVATDFSSLVLVAS